MNSICELVLADLRGANGGPDDALPQREVTIVTYETVDVLLASVRPELRMFVPNQLTEAGGQLGMTFTVKAMADFEPRSMRKTVKVLARLSGKVDEAQVMLDELQQSGRLDSWVDSDLHVVPARVAPDASTWSSQMSVLEMMLAQPLVPPVQPKSKNLEDQVWVEFQRGGLLSAIKLLISTIAGIEALLLAQIAEVERHPDYITLHSTWTNLHTFAEANPMGVAVLGLSRMELVEDLRDRRSSYLLRKLSRFRIAAQQRIRVSIDSQMLLTDSRRLLGSLRSWGDLRGIQFTVFNQPDAPCSGSD